ncbi:N-acetylmuramoyl-L-alanine amidase [Paenibacillus sp. KQZ6P-2]|uniref:N-acetylmuramoyl-L-alanine amidase n=1 Tax=Paenibacillus mangrovi TaxID=2931978 RepID=A0A9X1WRF4_9BACL|nr:N-acetylmuramoyl-L-alanine amidase [Paenibacillus mangrovi]MCJ8013704.1 N-acetylmuramoyl-L-alanine amidase [Paenibacillus mangrovi]
MINRSKRKRPIKAIFFLLFFFVIVLGIKTVWHTGSMVEKLMPALTRGDSTASVSVPNISLGNAKYRIVIDAGHGGKDPGATGASGQFEKGFNLSLAQRVYQLLEQEPMFEPRLTRTDDEFVALEDRAAIANDWNADALVSIHGNTYKDQTITGTETLYRHDDSIPLAQSIQEQVVKALGFPDRGVKEEHLKVLSLSQMPAVLVETGYLTNPEEESFLLSSKGQDLAAHAIVEGLKQYFSQNIPHKQSIDNELTEVPPPVSIIEDQHQGHSQKEQSFQNKVYFNGSAKDGKQVALTFDDGPDSNITPKILDILKENNIKATFFILGNRAKAHPDIVRRIVQEGHAIGNHSWSHPNFEQISMAEAMKEVDDTQDVLEEAVGSRPILFRPPYGALGTDKMDAIHQKNLAVVNWTVDTMDWSGVSSKEIMRLVRNELKPGGIVLQHTANGKNHLANTIEALQQMIPELTAEGYSFVTVPQLLHLSDSP